MTIRTYVKGVFAAVLAVAVIAPSLVLAQSGLTANITTPADGATFEVGENIQFRGTATGGSGQYTYAWTWGDGTGSGGQNETHSYNTTGSTTVTFEVQDEINTSLEAEHSITLNIVDDGGLCTPLINELDLTNPNGNHPRAEQITKNSAVIVWTTCENATSRVVYGTSQVTDEVAGNESDSKRGYQFSEPAVATTAKTMTHSVTLTDLQPNTKYFFRVLSSR